MSQEPLPDWSLKTKEVMRMMNIQAAMLDRS